MCLFLVIFPSGFLRPCQPHGLPGGWIGSMGMKSADCYGSAGLENMPIALASLISSTSIAVSRDKRQKVPRGRGHLYTVTWWRNPKRMEWNDSERRKQAEVLIGVRLLWRVGAEVAVCKGKKKGARMRTRSILCGDDNTWHLEDIQRQLQYIYCSVKYNLK